jgi:uncharacterized protein (TIGR01777 family)
MGGAAPVEITGHAMKIIIPGGSGLIGQVLARAFTTDGHEVVVLSRNASVNSPWRVVTWDGCSRGNWCAALEGADVVINLAGRSVNCRYTPANRRAITESRVNSTRVVGEAIAQAARPPRIWLQAATAKIYAHRYNASNDELTGIVGGAESDAPDTWRFSIDVATAWERAMNEAALPRTRKVLLRTSIVMSPARSSAFDIMLGLIRLGNGRQYVSWIHEADFIRAIYWVIKHDGLEGPVNLAAPHPLPNREFMRELRKAWGIRFGLPAAEWMLELGAVFLRTETELILKSRRVVPGLLLKGGFIFQFPAWPEAASDLCRRWRELNQHPGKL